MPRAVLWTMATAFAFGVAEEGARGLTTLLGLPGLGTTAGPQRGLLAHRVERRDEAHLRLGVGGPVVAADDDHAVLNGRAGVPGQLQAVEELAAVPELAVT